ncbi:MAG: FHA domain-containing protein [Kofleriaceae bacterium]|nr:FHA domain-containing protein [Myxococcales bacterium]MCB9561449.1 FHA domain-containing protein [Kofleriaceae bacterium]MCB9573504.1 FHA domain-containing protein [Kofleriaceae bacterium]
MLCSFAATRGHLCDAHAKAIATSSLTAEQVIAPGEVGVAALIDPWGAALPLAERTTVGRERDTADVALLHPSVSVVHATVARAGDAWTVTDHDSRNGTFVDGRRVTTAPLTGGARLRFGEITLYFVDAALPPSGRPEGPGRTTPTRRDQLIFSARLETAAGLCVELAQRIEGGVVRVDEARVDLGKLEFRLLQILTEARQAVADPEMSYVPWQELADRLEFRSHEADSENVRELVRRVRRKLQSAGIQDLIESRHGVGYRVSAALVNGDDA